MLRSNVRFSVLAVAGLALASACGSEDSKKTRTGEEAGAAGESSPEPMSGGSKGSAGSGGNAGGAGRPSADAGGGGAGAEPQLDGGSGGTLVTPQGGAAGEPSAASGAGGGNAEASQAGAGGADVGVAGAAGAPAQNCCQPLTCAEAFPNGDWGYYSDGCGQSELFCDCPAGSQRQDDFTCVACTPDPNFCDTACGDTFDNCGNPVTCADDCANSESVCFAGSCCYPTTLCDGGCGVVDDGCGGTVDCGETCDGAACVNGQCCYPSNPYYCQGRTCGTDSDGCEDIVCGPECPGATACIDGSCQDSECQARGFDCGTIYNPAADQDEECGQCSDDQTCIENVCVPICH